MLFLVWVIDGKNMYLFSHCGSDCHCGDFRVNELIRKCLLAKSYKMEDYLHILFPSMMFQMCHCLIKIIKGKNKTVHNRMLSVSDN